MDSRTTRQILDEAVAVLELEAKSILQLTRQVDDNFARLVEVICRCKGRVIIGGIGKSGIIARKIVDRKALPDMAKGIISRNIHSG